MSKLEGMLVAAPERWDEACFAVPALRALTRSGLVTGLVCRKEQEDFWKSVCDIPQFHFSEKTSASTLAKDLGGGWEAALVWDSGTASKAFSKAKIGRRIGPGNKDLKRLLTHPLEVQEAATEHRVRLYLNTAEQMGVAVNQPEFFAPAQLGINASPNAILLCPESDFGVSHEWPLERWQELGAALISQGKQVTIAGGISVRGLGEMLKKKLGSEAEFLDITPLGNALPLLAANQVVIAADGSAPHLAAHAGTTCVTLFGPNDATWKRPLGKRHAIVKRHVECAPCLSAKCVMDMRCQNELEVSRVLRAIPESF